MFIEIRVAMTETSETLFRIISLHVRKKKFNHKIIWRLNDFSQRIFTAWNTIYQNRDDKILRRITQSLIYILWYNVIYKTHTLSACSKVYLNFYDKNSFERKKKNYRAVKICIQLFFFHESTEVIYFSHFNEFL